MSFPLVDMTGRRIGRLLVLDRVGLDARRVATWRCRCDCGTEAIVAGRELPTPSGFKPRCPSAATGWAASDTKLRWAMG
jgi:hypothetical protein